MALITPNEVVPATTRRLTRARSLSLPPRVARPGRLSLFPGDQEGGDLFGSETAVSANADPVGREQPHVRPAAYRVSVSAQEISDLSNRKHPSIIHWIPCRPWRNNQFEPPPLPLIYRTVTGSPSWQQTGLAPKPLQGNPQCSDKPIGLEVL